MKSYFICIILWLPCSNKIWQKVQVAFTFDILEIFFLKYILLDSTNR